MRGGYLLGEHPFLAHYLTGGDPCSNTGTSGQWNSFTGKLRGLGAGRLRPVRVRRQEGRGVDRLRDRSRRQRGNGLYIDDTKVTTSGATLDAEGFETGLGPWTIAGAPAGSPGNVSEFARSKTPFEAASAVVTDDTVLLGFGVEKVATPAERATLLGKSLGHLLG